MDGLGSPRQQRVSRAPGVKKWGRRTIPVPGNQAARVEERIERSWTRRVLWFAAGWICVAVGVVGVALPGIPTTGPMILALACFSRSSPRFHDWLFDHPRFGPSLRRWRKHGTVPARAKAAALGCMALSLLLLWTSPLSKLAFAAVAALMLVGAAFILRCPSSPPASGDTPAARPS